MVPDYLDRLLNDQPEWQEDALCVQVDPDLWYPEKGGNATPAKRLCFTCPVRSECLQDALDNQERFGIWGGLTERERRKLTAPAIPPPTAPRRPGPDRTRHRDDGRGHLTSRGCPGDRRQPVHPLRPLPPAAGGGVSLTGDRYLETLVPSAEKLVRAVHTGSGMHVEALLADAEMVYGDPLDGARALVVLLAAMVPDDKPAAVLLRWRANPHEYRRLRAVGVASEQAAELAATVRPLKKGTAA